MEVREERGGKMMLQLQFHYKAMVFCTAGQPLFSAHVNVLVDNTIQSALLKSNLVEIFYWYIFEMFF